MHFRIMPNISSILCLVDAVILVITDCVFFKLLSETVIHIIIVNRFCRQHDHAPSQLADIVL